MKKQLSILLALMMLTVCSLAEEWVCPQCGQTNTGNFCTEDAQPRPETQTCSACGAENDADAQYCGNCGSTLDSSASATETPVSDSVGKIVTLGTYAGEQIEWRVLEDKGDGTYVLLSVHGLEAKAYNDEDAGVTWETCTLRSWLNGEFYQTAFTEEERAQIQLTDVVNADNVKYGTKGGNDTQDYVYLLSLDEVQKYFRLEDVEDEWCLGICEDLICMPLQHAVDDGGYTVSADEINEYQEDFSYALREGATWWWTRSPGYGSSEDESTSSAASVSSLGDVFADGYNVASTDGCVRPVIVARLS